MVSSFTGLLCVRFCDAWRASMFHPLLAPLTGMPSVFPFHLLSSIRRRDTARVLAMEALGHEVRCISKVSTPGESDNEKGCRFEFQYL